MCNFSHELRSRHKVVDKKRSRRTSFRGSSQLESSGHGGYLIQMRILGPPDVFLVVVAVLLGEAGSFSPTSSVALVFARHPRYIKDIKRGAFNPPNKVFVDVQRGEAQTKDIASGGGLDAATLWRWQLDDGDSGRRGGGGRRGGSNGDHGRSEGDDDGWDQERPELFLAATGMASALNGVAEVLQSLRSSRNPQVIVLHI